LGLLTLTAPAVLGAQNYIFKNPAPITLNDNGSSGSLVATPAVTYPSTITVSGLGGKTITKLTVTLNGFSHTWPDDVEILLVGPTGTNIILLSDSGGSFDATGFSITLDDSAAGTAPDAASLASGVYRPSNFGAGDTFPAPAPVASAATALSTFNGTDPNGVWSLYVVDDEGGDMGSISGGWSLTMTLAGGTFATQPGELIISEFRVRGPNGTNDEFVEIYNTNDVDHIVNSIDGSEGYALVASDGVARFVITNGTVIPAHGHFLGVNSVGYSLGGYPAGGGTAAAGNATYTTDIPDNAGLALFRTATPANFVLSNRLDAVGSTTEANALYKEGSGYLPLVAFSIDCSFYRKLTNGIFSGIPKDTGDNGDDFLFVDSNGTSTGAGQRLGAAGPENLSSPIWLPRGPSLVRTVLDSSMALSAAPNHVKDPTSDPANNATFGKLFLRRKFTNYSGNNLTRLRFRVVDLSTFPAPAGTADLRPMSYTNVVVVVNGTGTTVLGATLEQPPSQTNGGGCNSTFSVTNITAATPLTNGTSVNVQFTFGLQQTNTFSLALVPETLPASASDIWVINGNTESNAEVEATTPPTRLSVYLTVNTDNKVRFSTVAGRFYQLERRADLNSGVWAPTDAVYVGTGYPLEATHLNGKSFSSHFYRERVLP
jgi:hypothetical protein